MGGSHRIPMGRRWVGVGPASLLSPLEGTEKYDWDSNRILIRCIGWEESRSRDLFSLEIISSLAIRCFMMFLFFLMCPTCTVVGWFPGRVSLTPGMQPFCSSASLPSI